MIPEIYKNLVCSKACDKCFDTGLVRSLTPEILECPNITLNFAHARPNKASQVLKLSAQHVTKKGFFIFADEFEVARILTGFSKYNPCPKSKLIEFLYTDTNLSMSEKDTKIEALLTRLKVYWLLPIRWNHKGFWILEEGENANV